MDDRRLDRTAHEEALRSLEHTNRFFGTDRVIAKAITKSGSCLTTSVLDIGAGSGDLLEKLSHRLRTKPVSVWRRSEEGGDREPSPGKLSLIGCDISFQSIQIGRAWRNTPIHWISADARSLPFPDGSVDYVVCTLMLHHLDPPDVVAVLKEAARVCRIGFVAIDLARSYVAWVATWLVTRAVSRSYVFRLDGPRSVRAAFKKRELQTMAQDAGLQKATVNSVIPFRLLLTWRKPRMEVARSTP